MREILRRRNDDRALDRHRLRQSTNYFEIMVLGRVDRRCGATRFRSPQHRRAVTLACEKLINGDQVEKLL